MTGLRSCWAWRNSRMKVKSAGQMLNFWAAQTNCSSLVRPAMTSSGCKVRSLTKVATTRISRRTTLTMTRNSRRAISSRNSKTANTSGWAWQENAISLCSRSRSSSFSSWNSQTTGMTSSPRKCSFSSICRLLRRDCYDISRINHITRRKSSNIVLSPYQGSSDCIFHSTASMAVVAIVIHQGRQTSRESFIRIL